MRTEPGGNAMGIEDGVDKVINSETATHKHMVDYTLTQLADGRHLSEIMGDDNLTTAASHADRRKLLEDPRVVGAVHQDIITEMRAQLDAALDT
jgi:hypothetical protein